MALHGAILLLALSLSGCDAAGRPLKPSKDASATTTTKEQCSTPGSCDENDDNDSDDDDEEHLPPCSLYLAPSSIPDAGLGLFSGRNIPPKESVHEYLSYCEDEPDWVPLSESPMWTDIFIPVWNRSRRPFASWMGYVWPASPGELWNDADDDRFDGDEGLAFADGDVYLAEDGRRTDDGEGGLISPVSVFAFGLASLANSHPQLANIKRDISTFEDLGQNENHKGLLYPAQTSSPEESVMLNAPWDAGVGAFVPTYGNDFLTTKRVKEGTELLLNYGKRWHKRQGRRQANKDENKAAAPVVRSPEWLAENGICLFDRTLTSAPSYIPHAGRGALAARTIQKGEILAVSPMLAVARDDLKVAYSNGDQQLLNYAFGHPKSSVLLVPMAPVIGYVNHSNKKANAEIRWPQAGSDTQKLFGDPNAEGGWLSRPPADVLKMSGKIALEYVALRDLEEGEEIIIDYGEGWEQQWTAFARMHPYERPGYFRREAGVPDGFYPDAWLDLSDAKT